MTTGGAVCGASSALTADRTRPKVTAWSRARSDGSGRLCVRSGGAVGLEREFRVLDRSAHMRTIAQRLAQQMAAELKRIDTAGADKSSGEVMALITILGRTAPLVPVSSRGPRTAASWSVVLLRLAYVAATHALTLLRLLPMSDRDKDIEILALRHQLLDARSASPCSRTPTA
jgi:hypothetical protein